jgi:hypothetical protein
VKLIWQRFTEKGTVIIPLSSEGFGISNERVELDGFVFEPKTEVHITIIGTELGQRLQEKVALFPEVEAVIKKAFEETDWSFEKTGPIHLLSRDKEKTDVDGRVETVTEKSIILMLDMPGLRFFYSRLRELDLVEDRHPVPPPHVTMYTHKNPVGMGVPSDESLAKLSQGIVRPEALKSWGSGSRVI